MDRRVGLALAPLLACSVENPLFMLGSSDGGGGGTTVVTSSVSTSTSAPTTSSASMEGSGEGGTMTGSTTGPSGTVTGGTVTGGTVTGESGTTCPEGQEGCGPPVDPCVLGEGCSGAADWLVRSGNPAIQRGSDAAMLADGGVAVVGSFAGQIGVGDMVIDAAFDPLQGDGYLLRYSADGQLLWLQKFGGASVQWATTVTGMTGARIGVGGFFSGELIVGGKVIAQPGNNSGFVGVFDGDGALAWAMPFGAGDVYVRDLAATADGGLVVVGDFVGVLALGPKKYMSADLDLFVARFDVNGMVLWSAAPHGAFADGARGVAVGPDGSTTVTGYFSTALDLGGDVLNTHGGTDVFVARYGPDGAPVGSRGLGGPEADHGMAVAIGPDGRTVIAGLHGAGFDVGDGPFQTGMDGFDAFFAVFEPGGGLAWAHGGVPVASFDLGVDIDASGRVVALTRAVSVETDFGGGPVPPSNGAYLVKYGTDGAVAWVHALDGTVELFGHGLDVDADGRIAVSGSFNPSLMYPDVDTINSAGEFDVFAGRFQP